MIILCLVLSLMIHKEAWAVSEPVDLAPSAHAAILMERDSGRVIYAKNAKEPMKIASLTKIMTAIVAIENGKLDELVTIPAQAVGVEGSSIYLKQGDKVPLETLLYGLMLRSGNDAAVAIANHIGGSVEGFVYLMNEKAAYLGLKSTHFMNPHGLDHPRHYSSAYDLAVMTAYALKNPVFQQIVKTKVKVADWPGEEWRHKFYNKNRLLTMYPWADGVKTGYTRQARRTLVASATKDGQQWVAVTLNDGNDWKDMIQMFNYAFQHYPKHTVVKQGQIIEETTWKNDQNWQLVLTAEKTFAYPLSIEEKKKLALRKIIRLPLHTVKKNGQRVGSLNIYLDNQLIGSVPLVSHFRKEASVWKHIVQVFQTMMEVGIRQ